MKLTKHWQLASVMYHKEEFAQEERINRSIQKMKCTLYVLQPTHTHSNGINCNGMTPSEAASFYT